MSRHQAYRNYDYENDLDEYDGEDDHEEEGDVMSAEDKGTANAPTNACTVANGDVAQMEAATVEVRTSLGPQASKVTTAQIQESLWHTYYDVDKTVAFLITKYIDPPTPKAAKKTPVKNNVDGKSCLCSPCC